MTAPNAVYPARAIGPIIVQPNPVRAYLPPQYWKLQSEYFVYSVEFDTLGASQVNVPRSFLVSNDADFLTLGLSAMMATTAAGTAFQNTWFILCRVEDTGTGANWFNALQQLHNVFGRGDADGQGMKVLTYPRFVEAATEVTVTLTNLEATARRLWLSFHGLKIYRNRIR